jgi:hypothetical protein
VNEKQVFWKKMRNDLFSWIYNTHTNVVKIILGENIGENI